MAFIDNVVANLFTTKLNKVTPGQCRETILSKSQLVQGADEATWTKYRKLAKVVPNLNPTYDDVLNAIAKHRPDLLAVICSTPGGVDWLSDQVRYCRIKLGFDKAIFK